MGLLTLAPLSPSPPPPETYQKEEQKHRREQPSAYPTHNPSNHRDIAPRSRRYSRCGRRRRHGRSRFCCSRSLRAGGRNVGRHDGRRLRLAVDGECGRDVGDIGGFADRGRCRAIREWRGCGGGRSIWGLLGGGNSLRYGRDLRRHNGTFTIVCGNGAGRGSLGNDSGDGRLFCKSTPGKGGCKSYTQGRYARVVCTGAGDDVVVVGALGSGGVTLNMLVKHTVME